MQRAYIDFPANIPNQIAAGRVSLSTEFRGPNGAMQEVARTFLWKATLQFHNLDNDESGDLDAFLSQLALAGTIFRLPNFGHQQRGTLDGTPVIYGANQTGSTLITKGWTPNAQGVLKPGDFVTLATEQMVQVLSIVNADASGNASFAIAPWIRTAPADGSAINITKPTCVMYIPGRSSGSSTSPPLFSDFTFDCMEVLL